MLNVVITGNVAAGKSTVADWFGRWGHTVIDADDLVREVQSPGTKTLRDIESRFGKDVLLPDGALNRAALRKKVLADPAELASLNAIVHPAVARLRAERTEEARARGESIVVNDIPLLFEVLRPDDFDLVILVDAPDMVRKKRLLERGVTEDEAQRLMASQLPAGPKREQSHVVIDNNGSLADLEKRAREVWTELRNTASR